MEIATDFIASLLQVYLDNVFTLQLRVLMLSDLLSFTDVDSFLCTL